MVMVSTVGYLERTAASVDDKRSIDGDDVLKGDEVGEVAQNILYGHGCTFDIMVEPCLCHIF